MVSIRGYRKWYATTWNNKRHGTLWPLMLQLWISGSIGTTNELFTRKCMKIGTKLSKRKKNYVLKISVSVHCILGMTGNSRRLENPGSKMNWRQVAEGCGRKLTGWSADLSLPVSWTYWKIFRLTFCLGISYILFFIAEEKRHSQPSVMCKLLLVTLSRIASQCQFGSC